MAALLRVPAALDGLDERASVCLIMSSCVELGQWQGSLLFDQDDYRIWPVCASSMSRLVLDEAEEVQRLCNIIGVLVEPG